LNERVHQEEGGADGAHDVRPDARGVHEAHPDGQLVLEQGAVLGLEEDLEVTLGPPAALLENIAHLHTVWPFRALHHFLKRDPCCISRAGGDSGIDMDMLG